MCRNANRKSLICHPCKNGGTSTKCIQSPYAKKKKSSWYALEHEKGPFTRYAYNIGPKTFTNSDQGHSLQNNDTKYRSIYLNSSNTDGSFAMSDSTSFSSPYEILQIAPGKKVKEIILFYHKLVFCVYSLESHHRGDSNKYTYHHCIEDRKDLSELLPFASCPGTMINHRWLELCMSRTDFNGPTNVQAIEMRLYLWMKQTLIKLCAWNVRNELSLR